MRSEPNQPVPAPESDKTGTLDLDWLTIDADEEILWASTPHKSSLVPALLIGIPLSVLLIGIPILVSAYLNYTNTNYVVTTRGLYRKRGILSRDVKQISFDKVQNISYTQTAIGSSLGYGTVDISTAGSSGVELQFQNIDSPAEIQELISREIERREDSSRDQDGEADDVLDAILTELRGIRQALDSNSTTTARSAVGTETATGTDSATMKDVSVADDAKPADDQ